jgi:hypothetical protein
LAATVLVGKGKQGFDDHHRGQLMVLTGPMLVAGHELATAASKVLNAQISFEDISEAEAKRVLKRQGRELDDAEKEYLLEYYSLVREGKTNYISTLAYHAVVGSSPTHPHDFFKNYQDEFRPTKKTTSTRSTASNGSPHKRRKT